MARKRASASASGFSWAVPDSLGVPPDPLRTRIDLHNDACTLTVFDGDVCETKTVSMIDVAQALAKELALSTGLLPDNTLWWRNTARGPLTAIYEPPRIRRLALREDVNKPPRRFDIPLPGLVFMCLPLQAPWVWAVKKRPAKLSDEVFAAPLANVYDDGRTCPGNNKYPVLVNEITASFFLSFFSRGANLDRRSKKFPKSVIDLWKWLQRKKEYPVEDLVKVGTVRDLVELRI